MSEPLLQFRSISKRFGGTQAVEEVEGAPDPVRPAAIGRGAGVALGVLAFARRS